jgi:hypothetical protein
MTVFLGKAVMTKSSIESVLDQEDGCDAWAHFPYSSEAFTKEVVASPNV